MFLRKGFNVFCNHLDLRSLVAMFMFWALMAVGIQQFLLESNCKGFPERVSLTDAPIWDPGRDLGRSMRSEKLANSFYLEARWAECLLPPHPSQSGRHLSALCALVENSAPVGWDLNKSSLYSNLQCSVEGEKKEGCGPRDLLNSLESTWQEWMVFRPDWPMLVNYLHTCRLMISKGFSLYLNVFSAFARLALSSSAAALFARLWLELTRSGQQSKCRDFLRVRD